MTVEGRLHPLAIAVYGWRGLRVVGLLGVVSLLTSRSPGLVALLLGAGLLVVTPAAVLAWARFSYRVGGDALEVRSGVLTRTVRTIPLDRVRGIDVTVPPLHRLAGLVQARVEDASGAAGASGLTLAAIHRRDAAALRDAVLRARAPGAAEGDPPPPLARARATTLALAGATSARHLLVPVTALGALLNVAGDDRLPWVRGAVDAALRAAPSDATGIALVALGALAAAALVAAAGSLLVDGGFVLRDDGERLTAERGLLARRSVGIVRGRVSALEVRDSPAWRVVRLAELRAVVGGVSGDDRQARGRTTLLPAGRGREAWLLARRLDPRAELGLDAHPARGRRRRLVRACAPPALAAALAAALGAPGPVPPALAGAALLMVPVALDRHRSLGNRLGGGRLALREGSLSRRHAIIAPDAIVAYRVRSSPGQRRAGLCTLTVFLGQGAGSRRALDVDAAHAAGLLARLEPGLVGPLVAPDPLPRE